jgi:hypothetical protein
VVLVAHKTHQQQVEMVDQAVADGQAEEVPHTLEEQAHQDKEIMAVVVMLQEIQVVVVVLDLLLLVVLGMELMVLTMVERVQHPLLQAQA